MGLTYVDTVFHWEGICEETGRFERSGTWICELENVLEILGNFSFFHFNAIFHLGIADTP